MGTVHLTNGHHGLVTHCGEKNPQKVIQGWILLTEELLKEKIWVYGLNRHVTDDHQEMIVAALRGFISLKEFDAAVSYHVDCIDGVKRLCLPKRVWAEISLNGAENVILRFSHDTRDNAPFRVLSQWLEIPEEITSDNDAYELELNKWNDPEKWRDFYLDRIAGKLLSHREYATEIKMKASEAEEKATLLGQALTRSRKG